MDGEYVMGKLKSNIFVNGLIIAGAAGVLYLIVVCGYLLIAGIIDFLELNIWI